MSYIPININLCYIYHIKNNKKWYSNNTNFSEKRQNKKHQKYIKKKTQKKCSKSVQRQI